MLQLPSLKPHAYLFGINDTVTRAVLGYKFFARYLDCAYVCKQQTGMEQVTENRRPFCLCMCRYNLGKLVCIEHRLSEEC